MLRTAFYPVIIAIYPVLSSFVGEGKWQPLEDHIRPALISLAIVLLAWFVASRIMRDAAKAAFVVSTFWFLLFCYGEVSEKLFAPSFIINAIALLIALAIVTLLFNRAKNGKPVKALAFIVAIAAAVFLAHPLISDGIIYASLWTLFAIVSACWAGASSATRITPYLNVAAIGLIAIPLFGTVQLASIGHQDEAKIKRHPFNLPNATPKNAPDVYQFILDGYGRADELQKTFAYDNSAFIKQLQDRGFYVASQSRSNYVQTEQSLSSMLNGAYLSDLVPGIDRRSRDRSPLHQLILHNSVAETMQEHGYEYVTISTGFPIFNRNSSRNDLSDPIEMSIAEGLVVYDSPEAGFLFLPRLQHRLHRERILRAFEESASLPPTNKPRYVLVHILAPHPPFAFDRNGNPVEPPRAFGLWDGAEFTRNVASSAEYTNGYPEQLQYVNKLVLQTIDRIKRNSKTPPIIIIQGDHGSRRDTDFDRLDRTDVTESFKNLVAVDGPPRVRKNLYLSITLVNLMSAILDGIFNAPFKPQPDRSIYTTWQRPFDYTDVTDRVR